MGNLTDFNLQNASVGMVHSRDPNRDIDDAQFQKILVKKQPAGLNGSLFVLLGMKDRQAKKVNSTRPFFHTSKVHFPAACATSAVAAAAQGTTSTIPLDNVEGMIPNQFLVNDTTKEQMLIVAVPTSNSVIVQRGTGSLGTSNQIISTGDRLSIIGTAFEEGSLRPIPVSTKDVEVDNLTQIFRNTWSLTDTEDQIHREGRQTRSRSVLEGMWQHSRDIETALWFGQRYSSMRNGKPFRKMDGVDAQIRKHAPNNVFNAGPTTSFSQLEFMLDQTKQVAVDSMFMSNEFFVMTGNVGLRVLNQIGRASGLTINIEQGMTKFGFRFLSVTTIRGTYHFMHNPMFDTNPAWSSTAYVINLSAMDMMYLGNRKQQHIPFNNTVQGAKMAQAVDSGVDASGGTITSELTLQVYAPETMAIIQNLSMGVCDDLCITDPAQAADFYPELEGNQPNLFDPSETGVTVG